MTSSQHVTWKSSKAVWLCIFITNALVSVAQASWTESLGPSGSLRTAYWSDNKEFLPENNYLVSSAWLTLRPEEMGGFKFYFDGFVQGEDLAREEFSRVDVREAFVEKSWGDFDFKVGRIITVWGRADKINPTDSMSVRNFKLLMTDDEDQRTGIFTTQVTYTISDYRISALWLPEWRSPTFPIPPLTGVTLRDVKPESPENQVALKVDRSGGAVDWSLSYYKGYNHFPDLDLLAISPTGVDVGFNYGKVQVFGADFASTQGQYGFRGELAYLHTEDRKGDNPLRQNSMVNAVLGIENSPIENLNINVQLLFRHVLDYQSLNAVTDPGTRALAEQVTINSNQVAETFGGLSFRPSYKMWNETLEVELAFVMWAKYSDSLLRPKATYAINDSWKLILGGEIYNGPANSFWGRLEKASTVFTELRWLF